MEEKINKEFEQFQEDLEIRRKKLKLLVSFNLDDKINEELKELNDKQITL